MTASAQTICQALIEAELTAVIGAPYERTPERSAQRKGHRQRRLATTIGDLELRIPNRAGSWGSLGRPRTQQRWARPRSPGCSCSTGEVTLFSVTVPAPYVPGGLSASHSTTHADTALRSP
jgi:hypothetical protein